MPDFKLATDLRPTGDQPKAIAELTEGVNDGEKDRKSGV